jgi:hypothetical protein
VSPMMTCSRADQSVHAEEKGRKASGEATVIVILVPPRSMNALLPVRPGSPTSRLAPYVGEGGQYAKTTNTQI